MDAGPTVAFAYGQAHRGRSLFTADHVRELRGFARVPDADPIVDLGAPGHAELLASVDVLVTHWGVGELDERVLSSAPRLAAVVHAAGSVKGFVTDAVWERGIRVSSAAAANAVPVAEFTVAAILWSNKRVLDAADRYRRRRDTWEPWAEIFPDIGNYRKTVGVVGASRVGRRVLELLRPFDLSALVSDPYLEARDAADLGATAVPLEELFARSDVVTLHAPVLPETRGMVGGALLSSMRDGATLVNTARGALVDEDALVAELRTGRLRAVLDTTDPEPPAPGSPLFELPNVLLTPHLAGPQGDEIHRSAQLAVDEVRRFAAGEPMLHEITRDDLARLA